ncbi:exonuclease sbcCD subunit D [Idiomarina sp. OT37-5b]|jgi:exonuclease SbcD|uniref:exonuclease SbcCD subunit D n=1 Tax=Idiomarina sp. OT37-5b TaxID=2100422 RepID=UPI000CFA0D30|nr:exonuclease SbcCD subunit D [Idiomarina sp. OT37-5b]AVJ57006.1 exonuclease sbcCD subunit D [Idiomarina sp. OT37-5b]
MRILHTSDWHLGRLFHQISLVDEQRCAIEQVLDYIKTYQPDVVIIAGDIYDRSVPPASAISLFDDFVDTCLSQLGVPIIAISGNHDGAERLGFASRQLATSGMYLVTTLEQMTQPIVLDDEHGPVDFWAVPFHDPAQVADFTGEPQRDYNHAHETLVNALKKTNDRRSVLVSHCYLDGANESDSERPLSMGGADRVDWQLFSDFDYTALGHLHQPQYKGRENIRYSGSLLKYSFSEQHQKKSLTLVDMDADGNCSIQLLPIQPRNDLRVLKGTLEEILSKAKEDARSNDYVQVILTDDEALLNPMARVREHYPNVMELKKERFQVRQGEQLAAAGEQLKRSELDIFEDFFSQVHHQQLNDEQRQQLEAVLAQIADQERQS